MFFSEFENLFYKANDLVSALYHHFELFACISLIHVGVDHQKFLKEHLQSPLELVQPSLVIMNVTLPLQLRQQGPQLRGVPRWLCVDHLEAQWLRYECFTMWSHSSLLNLFIESSFPLITEAVIELSWLDLMISPGGSTIHPTFWLAIYHLKSYC